MFSRDSHPSDSDLMLALGRELPSRRQRAIDAHATECATCRTRIADAAAAVASVTDWSPSDSSERDPRSRARLAAALDRAAEDWDTSWTMRLRAIWAASRPLATAAVVTALVLVTATTLRSKISAGSVDSDRPSRHHRSLPVASLTPGAVAPMTVADLCAGVRPTRRVTADVRDRVLRSYGMEGVSEDAYELDALITPELGGSTDARNLWPQRYESPVWNARVKDELENVLPRLVCDGQVDLALAQRDIATDWIAAYQKYFKTSMPLQAHVGPPGNDSEDDDELEIVPATYRIALR